MATAEDTINTFQFGRELKVVPGMKTQNGAEIMLGFCTAHNVNSSDRRGPGLIGIFEKPLTAGTLKPKPLGYLAFTVGPTSIVCSMTTHLNTMALNSSLPSWIVDVNEIASGNGLQAIPMEKIDYIVKDGNGNNVTKREYIPNRAYTNLGLGELLVTQLEAYARSIGIKKIAFDDANEHAGRLLKRLGYLGEKNFKKTLE